jgi:hypothetical protein
MSENLAAILVTQEQQQQQPEEEQRNIRKTQTSRELRKFKDAHQGKGWCSPAEKWGCSSRNGFLGKGWCLALIPDTRCGSAARSPAPAPPHPASAALAVPLCSRRAAPLFPSRFARAVLLPRAEPLRPLCGSAQPAPGPARGAAGGASGGAASGASVGKMASWQAGGRNRNESVLTLLPVAAGKQAVESVEIWRAHQRPESWIFGNRFHGWRRLVRILSSMTLICYQNRNQRSLILIQLSEHTSTFRKQLTF